MDQEKLRPVSEVRSLGSFSSTVGSLRGMASGL